MKNAKKFFSGRKNNSVRLALLLTVALFLISAVICISASDEAISAPEYEQTPDTRDGRATVTVVMGGYEYATCNSPITTVGELISRIGIVLDDSSVTDKNEDDVIEDGMTITIGRYTREIYSEYEEVPYAVTYIESQTIPKGETKLVSAGKNGKSIVTHEITYIDGVFYSDEKISTENVVEAENEVRYKGVGGTVTASDGSEYEYSYYIDVIATAYHTGGTTATGKEATDGIIAVDPRVISYGTKVFVTGKYGEIGVCSAEDTGGGIKGNRIDVCMSGTTEELLRFGRRNMRVYILE